MDFQDRTVLITGGSSGIGLAAAKRFAARGADVIISGRDTAKGQAAAQAIATEGGTARFIAADLADPAAAHALAEQSGPVDVLVNNAGIFPAAPSHELADATVGEVLQVNVASLFALTAALVPAMTERGGGAIVNISTMVASFGMPGMSIYGASKAAVESLTQTWAAEYGAGGVRVNAVAPGPTRTPGTADFPPEALDALAASLPLEHAADPDEIAAAIVFLASDEASFITGTTLAADGGRTAV